MRQLSENTRKTILWSAVIILGIILFFWWGKSAIKDLQSISFPKVPKELEESIQQAKEEFTFPAFEDIEIPEEVLQELKEYEQSQGQ